MRTLQSFTIGVQGCTGDGDRRGIELVTRDTSMDRHVRGRYASLKLRMIALSTGLACLAATAFSLTTALADDRYQRPAAAGGALYEEIADQQVGYGADEPNVTLGGRVALCRNGLAIYYEFESRKGPYGTTRMHANSVGRIESLEDGGSRLVARVRFVRSTRPANRQPFSATFQIHGPESRMVVQTSSGLILEQGNTTIATIQGKLDASADCETARRNL